MRKRKIAEPHGYCEKLSKIQQKNIEDTDTTQLQLFPCMKTETVEILCREQSHQIEN